MSRSSSVHTSRTFWNTDRSPKGTSLLHVRPVPPVQSIIPRQDLVPATPARRLPRLVHELTARAAKEAAGTGDCYKGRPPSASSGKRPASQGSVTATRAAYSAQSGWVEIDVTKLRRLLRSERLPASHFRLRQR